MLHRRQFLAGTFSVLAAPAIVRASSIMPVSAMAITDPWVSFQSWPLGLPNPDRFVSGYDVLSRARAICEMTGGSLVIRPKKLAYFGGAETR